MERLRILHSVPRWGANAQYLEISGAFFAIEPELQHYPTLRHEVVVRSLDVSKGQWIEEARFSLWGALRQAIHWDGRRLTYFGGEWEVKLHDSLRGSCSQICVGDAYAYSYSVFGKSRGEVLYERNQSNPDDVWVGSYLRIRLAGGASVAEESKALPEDWKTRPGALHHWDPLKREYRWPNGARLHLEPRDANVPGKWGEYLPFSAVPGPDGYLLIEGADSAQAMAYRILAFDRTHGAEGRLISDDAEEIYRSGGPSTDALFSVGSSWVWLMDKEVRIYG